MTTFQDECAKAMQKGGAPALAKRVLLGITKGVARDGQLPVGGLLPGDLPRAYRGGDPHQAGLPRRSEGERHHRQADPRRYGHEGLQRAFRRSLSAITRRPRRAPHPKPPRKRRKRRRWRTARNSRPSERIISPPFGRGYYYGLSWAKRVYTTQYFVALAFLLAHLRLSKLAAANRGLRVLLVSTRFNGNSFA